MPVEKETIQNRHMYHESERRRNDALQHAHWVVSLLKRWLLGTHGGAVKTRHLQSYLDEFQFRYNRRKTNGAARVTARAIEQLHAFTALQQLMLSCG